MIRVETIGALRRVIIDRPAKANALTASMLDDLTAAIGRVREDPVRALVITGSGRVFSAGADLDEARTGLATHPVWERLSQAVATTPCLTVAALNGTLAGGAFGMVLACDLRIAVDHARFFYPVMRHGFLPQPSDPDRLAALVGPSRARLLLLAGERWDARTACAYGLVDKVVAPGGLDDAVAEMTRVAIEGRPEILFAIKSLFHR